MRWLTGIMACVMWIPSWALASDLKGLDIVRAWALEWDGTGVAVAQPEAGDPVWQVNPAAVGQPVSLFTWISGAGSSTQFPNALGVESGHANQVAGAWYQSPEGVSPGVTRVYNYEASHFYSLIQNRTAIPAVIVNQSFVFNAQLPLVDQDYDSFAARYGTLFVSGVGNGGSPKSPATCYNGIAVGTFGPNSSVGPTSDGRCKPDLVAPGSFTSFSTPLAAGSAALMLEAITNGSAGPGNIGPASDHRTLKALLLNGAVKPVDWTNGSAAPLDARYGCGELEIFSSLRQLVGGRRGPVSTATYPVDQTHPPAPSATSLPSRRGWDLRTLNSTVTQTAANHYQFDVLTPTGKVFKVSSTLVWDRAQGATTINDLDLFLFHGQTGELIASSQSAVNNVEHLHVLNLSPGTYVLQVLKHGGLVKRVTNQETYALAFDFGPPENPQWNDPTQVGTLFEAMLSAEPHEAYVVESTSNLVDWISLSTNAIPATGRLPFSYAADPGPSQRFFRAVLARQPLP